MSLMLLIPLLLAAVVPAHPAPLAPAESDSLRTAIEKDRNGTMDWLRSKPTSYLATVQRVDFAEKTTLTVGRAPENDVRIDDPEVAARHLRVTVVGDSFHVEALDDTAHFRAGDAVTRSATLPPSGIGLGRFS